MPDLTGAGERRTTVVLALLVVAVMLLPVAPLGAQIARPTSGATEPSPEAEPTPTPTPTVEAPSIPPVPDTTGGDAGTVLDGLSEAPEGDAEGAPEGDAEEAPEDDAEEAPEDEGGSTGVAPPTVPGAQGGTEPTPSQVQAEGGQPQEVVAAPEAPEPSAEEGALIEGGLAASAEGELPADAPPAIEPPAPAAVYGSNVVPSMGTAARPLTNPYTAEPMVLAPMVAGQQVKVAEPLSDRPVVDKAALLQAAEPVQTVAAASLDIIQPSWYATVLALLVLIGSALYATVLRRRGEDVPEAIRFTGAVRPGDHRPLAVRSVRPRDLQGSARSVRP